MNKRSTDGGGSGEINDVRYGRDHEYDSDKSLKGWRAAWRSAWRKKEWSQRRS